mgnify:CR=1 FL=1
MIREFNAKKISKIFIYVISFFIMFNIIFGETNLFLLEKYNLKILEMRNNNKKLNDEKDRLNFFINQFESNNTDFKETLIRQELNYKKKDENVYYY